MELLVLLLLILLNGAFAMSEMAVVSSRKPRLQQWADEQRPGAAAALALANQPSIFLSTIQVGITLIGITSGAFGEATLAAGLAAWLAQWPWVGAYAQGLSIALVVAGITIASLIIGELVPKRIALLNPEAIASVIARPMQLLALAAHPIVRALSWVTEGVLALLRLRAKEPPPVTEEEIKVLMEQGAEAGVFAEHEQKLVSRVFRFDHVKVGSILTPRIEITYLDLNDPPEVNMRRITKHSHSRFPVIRGRLDRVEGVVFARNLLADALAGKPFQPARHMTKPLFVPSNISAMELIERFRKQRQTLAIALSEHGTVDGVVTVHDVLEALVGDIASLEEKDLDMVRREDASWLIDGSVSIERLRSTLGIEQPLPGEDNDSYHTAGGFVMERLGRVPALGDSFEWHGWRWEVVDMDFRRVDKVLATPLHSGSEPRQ